MAINLSPGELFLGGVAALAVLIVIVKTSASTRRARAAAEIARVGTSVVSLAGRVVLTAGLIVGVQWVVITHTTDTTLLLVVLGLPALLAAYTLTKALTVTTVRTSSRGWGGRR